MVCRRTPLFSGVMHIRAPVPARSSSSRQHPSQLAKRASTCAAGAAARAARLLRDCANALPAVRIKARTKVIFFIMQSPLEREVNAGAETEAAQIDRLEINEVLVERRVLPGVAAFERQHQVSIDLDVGAAEHVGRRRPAAPT